MTAPAPPIDRVVVLHDYSGPVGGAGVLALLSLRGYRARGLPVTFVTGEGTTPELDALGIDLVGLGGKGLLEAGRLEAFRKGYHNREAEAALDAWIDRNDTPGTVYHLHNWSQILSPSILAPLRRVASRTTISCHDFFNACPNGGFVHFGKAQECDLRPLGPGCFLSQCDRRSPLHKYWRFARHAHFVKLADAASSDFAWVFLHERMQAKYERAGFEGQIKRIIRNPVRPYCETRIAAENNPDFIFIGRVGRDKGTDIALEAARRAGVRLTVVGAGDEVERLRDFYPEAHFAGWCDRAGILEHVRRARAIIMPSRVVEPFGLVALEAATSGLPVVMSASAFLSADMLRIGAGREIPAGDVDALAALMRELAGDDAAIAAMSAAGFAKGHTLCHTEDGWVDEFVSLFRERLSQLPRSEAAE